MSDAKEPDAREQYDEKEAQERFEKALRGGLKTSPKPHVDMKIRKRKDRKPTKVESDH